MIAWYWLPIGMVASGFVAAFVIALCVIAKDSDQRAREMRK